MTPSTYFGNTLTDLQSGITAADRNQGDTQRAGSAANAAKMAAYFGLLSNKARTEAEAKSHDAENARQYFALNMADAQKKADIAARSADMSMEWGKRAELQQLQESGLTERNAAAIAGQEKVAGLNLQRDLPQVAVQKMRDVEQQKAIDFEKQQQAQMSAALAGQANQELEKIKSDYRSAIGSADAVIKRSWPAALTFGNLTPGASQDQVRQKAAQDADVKFNQAVTGILNQINKNGVAVKFENNRFKPVFTMETAVVAPRSMLPDVMTGNAVQEQVETEPAPMAAIAQPRMIDPGVRPAPMNIFGPSGVPFQIPTRSTGNVTVISPQGIPGTIPAANLQRALQMGYKLAR